MAAHDTHSDSGPESGNMMKAIVQDKYGSPDDVLQLREIDKPVVGDAQAIGNAFLWIPLFLAIISISGCREIRYQELPIADQGITLAITGDVMLGRGVDQAVATHGYRYPWGNMLPDLTKNDLLLVNLETTLTRSAHEVPKVFNFRAKPDRVQCLLEIGVDVCNVANNHILDYSLEGMKETLSILHTNGIQSVGAGNNWEEACAPVIVEKEGLRIGILGCTDNEPEWRAKASAPGTCYASIQEFDYLTDQISSLTDRVDIIVLSIHWGPNKRERPSSTFQHFARRMIHAGVDILHGHSAHIFQGIEVYEGGVILYDAGDFVDDYVVDPDLRNDWSYLYRFTLEGNTIRGLELLPVHIHQMQVNHASPKDRERIFRRLYRLSEPFGTEFEKRGEQIFVRLPEFE